MLVNRKAAARPHLIRALVAFLAALAGLVVASELGQLRDTPGDPATAAERLFTVGGTLLLLVAGVVVVRSLARAAREATREHHEDRRGAPLTFVISVLGYAAVLVSVLAALGYNPGGLLLGGAVTGVVLGIAAQQTLGNVFAGIVLMIVRPFTVGDKVFLRTGVGEYEGDILDMGVFYVTIEAQRGRVALPNSAVLASAVGPGAKRDDREPQETTDDTAPLVSDSP